MSGELHTALEHLRPKDFSNVPLDDLSTFLSKIFDKAEFIANSVPPPPHGTPYESAQPSRTDKTRATCAAELTISAVRRPEVSSKERQELHKAWGKPLKLGAKEAATGISVFKMAGNDRHGAWFARTSVTEGLGFAKWKQAMMREFPESLEVQGGPGVGNIRGIGGDQRLEDVDVKGVGRMQVYQLSAQFPGPTTPREFITLLLTSDHCLSETSKVGTVTPRHYMVVSIPVTHPDAPARNGMVLGQYESVEMIREIPLPSSNRAENTDNDDSEANPIEWIMVTRSDPGGGIPRFMVERGTPGSIVQDAGKFLDWACAKEDFPSKEENEKISQDNTRPSTDNKRHFSRANSNGLLAGVGTSIADRPNPATFRKRSSQRTISKSDEQPGIIQSVAETLEPYVPNAINPLHRSDSVSSSSSSIDSFASAEQFTTAPDGLPIDDKIATPSTASEQSLSLGESAPKSREIQKIEQKRQQLHERLEATRLKQSDVTTESSSKTAKDLEKANEKHNRDRKKQEDKFAREVQKLEARRERETQKLLARQQKEADKNTLLRVQRERDEWKQKAELAEQETKLLQEQIGDLQKENTTLTVGLGKTDVGRELLRGVREELDSGKGRKRGGSRGSFDSVRSNKTSARKSEAGSSGLQNVDNGDA